MNVAQVCKQYGVYLPHELMGFPRDSLPGMLLSIELLNQMNIEENRQADPKVAAQTARFRKFNENR